VSLYELLLLLHIFAAIIWVGAATTYFALELRTDLSGDLEREASQNDDAEWLAPRLFIPASMATFIFGAFAAIEGSWDFGSLWIVIGLTGFGISFATGVGYFEPEIRKLADAIERDGAAHPEVRRRTANLKMVGRIELAVLYVVVASMVAKPTGADGGFLVVLTLALAGAVALAFIWRRRMSVSTQPTSPLDSA
jgi:uncharacterized membrane protein